MGEGLYFSNDGHTVYCEPFEDLEDQDDRFDSYNDLILLIRELLPASWYPVDRDWISNDERVIAQNGHYAIWLTEDSYSRVHITYGLRSDLEDGQIGLVTAHLYSRANAFFDALQCYHELRVRASAWTSAKRLPRSTAARAA